MKFRSLLLILSLCTYICVIAKNESKLPETYSFTRGLEAVNNGDNEQAMEWFNKEIKDNPGNGYAYLYISLLHYHDKNYGLALTAVNNALKKIPKKDAEYRATSYATRAEINVAMTDTLKAIEDYNQAIKINPEDESFYESRAEIYYDLGEYALSDADYAEMIKLEQGNVTGYMGMGRNAHAQERWDDAIDLFTRVTKLDADFSPAYAFRAGTYMAMENWNEAANDIVKALAIDGNKKAFYLLQQLPARAYSSIVPRLKVQMTKYPNDVYWPYCLGVIEQINDNPETAIKYYERANNLDANSLFLEKLAQCYQKMHKYDVALTFVDRAITLNPDDDDLVDLKADVLDMLGRFDDCIVERDRYIALNPEYSLAYMYKAGDLMYAGRFDEAAENYEMAVALAPVLLEYPDLLMRRGDAYRITGKNDEAVNDYHRIIEIEKDSVLNTDSRTPFAYTGLGQYDLAESVMLNIVETDTTDRTSALYNMACIYARTGKNEKAMEYLEEALANGYINLAHLSADYDFATIKESEAFKALLQSYTPVYDLVEDKNSEESGKIEIVEIPFTKESGVTKVECTINGLPLHFVFDTGAADVTMSMVEANFMLKNGYIKPSDIIGSTRYVDANGDISEGTVLNLNKVNFGGLELDNVRASVIRNQKAPLLLGQSVLGRLGKIEIDNGNSRLIISHRVD